MQSRNRLLRPSIVTVSSETEKSYMTPRLFSHKQEERNTSKEEGKSHYIERRKSVKTGCSLSLSLFGPEERRGEREGGEGGN